MDGNGLFQWRDLIADERIRSKRRHGQGCYLCIQSGKPGMGIRYLPFAPVRGVAWIARRNRRNRHPSQSLLDPLAQGDHVLKAMLKNGFLASYLINPTQI